MGSQSSASSQRRLMSNHRCTISSSSCRGNAGMSQSSSMIVSAWVGQ